MQRITPVLGLMKERALPRGAPMPTERPSDEIRSTSPIASCACTSPALADARSTSAGTCARASQCGEIEPSDTSGRGIPVRIAARIAAAARPGEMVVSSTVEDIVAGPGIAFQVRGGRRLARVSSTWRLFPASARPVALRAAPARRVRRPQRRGPAAYAARSSDGVSARAPAPVAAAAETRRRISTAARSAPPAAKPAPASSASAKPSVSAVGGGAVG